MAVDADIGWEGRDGVAAKNVEGHTGSQVLVGIEWHFVGTFAGVSDFGWDE